MASIIALGIAYALRPKMLDAKYMLMSSLAFLREHPEEILRAARNARRLRFGLPINALRWLATQFASERGPSDVEIEPVPPGIRVSASVVEMDTPLRASAVLSVEKVRISPEELRVEVRLNEVSIRVAGEGTRTPLAALIRSGALDLSRVADLVAQLPTRPALLIEAIDNKLVLDFMRHPRIADDDRLRRIIGSISTLLSIEAVEADPDHLDVAIRALPAGFLSLLGLG